MPVNCPCLQEVLSDALDRSGMSVDTLARRLGSRSAVQATGWVHGARLPDAQMIVALSEQLGIDAFYLCLVCWMDERPAYRSDLALTMEQRGWPVPTAAQKSLVTVRPPKRSKKKSLTISVTSQTEKHDRLIMFSGATAHTNHKERG